MGALRRYVFPVAWLAIFAVIAAALFKLAFVDGMRAEAVTEQPSAQVVTPSVPAVLGTVTNVVQVEGTVASDPAVTVRSTAEGAVNYLFVEPGANVTKGDPLFQVQKLVEPDLAQVVAAEPDPDEEPAAPAAPTYTYANVVATAAGKLTELSVLVDQQISVGSDAATIAPGTFSVSGTLTADQQFRLLDRPSTATVTVNGGPAPFECKAVSVGEAPDDGGAAPVQQPPMDPFGPVQPVAATGTVNCAVPADVKVFAGLGATIDITAGTAENVVTVPTTAVQGSVDTGLVWVVENDGGAPVERSVTLGLNDGMQVEIVEGLDEGEMVLQFIPGAPGEQLMPGMEGDFGMMMGG